MELRTNIGELDTLVTVQRCIIGKGDRGQKTYTFDEHSKVWAKVERSASEYVGHGNLDRGMTVTATMYKIAELTSRWRLIIGEDAYEITAIDMISRFSPLCQLTLSAVNG